MQSWWENHPSRRPRTGRTPTVEVNHTGLPVAVHNNSPLHVAMHGNELFQRMRHAAWLAEVELENTMLARNAEAHPHLYGTVLMVCDPHRVVGSS